MLCETRTVHPSAFFLCLSLVYVLYCYYPIAAWTLTFETYGQQGSNSRLSRSTRFAHAFLDHRTILPPFSPDVCTKSWLSWLTFEIWTKRIRQTRKSVSPVSMNFDRTTSVDKAGDYPKGISFLVFFSEHVLGNGFESKKEVLWHKRLLLKSKCFHITSILNI